MIIPVMRGGKEVYFSWVKGGTVEYIMPENVSLYLAWMWATYTADATVATRTMSFGLIHAGEYTHNIVTAPGITAGTTQTMAWGAGGANAAGGAAPTQIAPGNGLLSVKYPLKIGISVVNGVAGDTWKCFGVYYLVPCPMP